MPTRGSSSTGPSDGGPVTILDADVFADLPDEIAIRVLGWAIAWAGSEGPVELGKLEAFYEAMRESLVAYALSPSVEPCSNSPSFAAPWPARSSPWPATKSPSNRPRRASGPKKAAEPLNHAPI